MMIIEQCARVAYLIEIFAEEAEHINAHRLAVLLHEALTLVEDKMTRLHTLHSSLKESVDNRRICFESLKQIYRQVSEEVDFCVPKTHLNSYFKAKFLMKDSKLSKKNRAHLQYHVERYAHSTDSIFQFDIQLVELKKEVTRLLHWLRSDLIQIKKYLLDIHRNNESYDDYKRIKSLICQTRRLKEPLNDQDRPEVSQRLKDILRQRIVATSTKRMTTTNSL